MTFREPPVCEYRGSRDDGGCADPLDSRRLRCDVPRGRVRVVTYVCWLCEEAPGASGVRL